MMRRVGLIALGVLVLVVGIWYGAFWRSESSHLKAVRAQQSQVAAQLSTDESNVATLDVEEKSVKLETKAFSKLVQAIPNGPSLDQILKTVNQAAKASGTVLTSIGTPQPSGWGVAPGSATTPSAASGTTSGPQTVTLSVTVGGTVPQLLKFVTKLDSAPRTYVVNALNLVGEPGKQSVSFAVNVYYESAASSDPVFPGPVPVP